MKRPQARSPKEHGEQWAAIGTRVDRMDYLRTQWPLFVAEIEAEAREQERERIRAGIEAHDWEWDESKFTIPDVLAILDGGDV